MQIPAVIDVAIGLVVLYLLLSTLSSFVVELIATWRWWRKRLLYETIARMITGAEHYPAPAAPYVRQFKRMIAKTRERIPEKYRSLPAFAPPPDSRPERLTVADITDAPALQRELSEAANPISKFLLEKFDREFAKDFLTAAPAPPAGAAATPRPAPSASAWIAQLNRIIEDETLYERDRFKAVALSTDTQALLTEVEGEPGVDETERRHRLNRLLLEDAFPGAITCKNRLAAETLREFWEHPLARNLAPDRELPSYVEPATFACIVIDVAIPGAADGTLPATAEGLERVIELGRRSGHGHLMHLREQLLTIHRLRDVHRGGGSQELPPLAALRAGIERWYGEAMERLSGQYKRKVQKALFWTGLVIAALLNGDTIRTIHVLTTDDALRAATAAYGATLATPSAPQTSSPENTNAAAALPPSSNRVAIATAPTGTTPAATTNEVRGALVRPPNVFELQQSNELAVATLRAELADSMRELQKLQRLGFPLGWKSSPFDAETRAVDFAPYGGAGGWAFLFKLLGLFATAFAVSLGAPFWFDLLNKLVSLRAAGKRAETPGQTSPSADKAASPAAAQPGAAQGAGAAATPSPQTPFKCVNDLEKAQSGFNPRKAYWCAEAADLAYASKESVRAAAEQWGMGEPWFFDQTESAQGFLAVDVNKKVAVLAFRGTEKKLEDWKADAEFALVKSPAGPGETHKGFTEGLGEVYDGVKKELGERLGPQTLLYITGHSLGGGLATVMAARLAADKSRGVHAVHTFGSPRVGDPEFVSAYQLALGRCTYRIVNAEDLVTRVPPRVIPGTKWRYDHVGQIVFFDSDGRMQMNAGFWDRFVNTVIHAVADFRSTGKAALKDHSMEGYVRLLKKSASENS